jgi:hypothetical protein
MVVSEVHCKREAAVTAQRSGLSGAAPLQTWQWHSPHPHAITVRASLGPRSHYTNATESHDEPNVNDKRTFRL